MAVTMCRGYSTFYGHILCTVLLISCLGDVLCQSTSDATTSDSISPTPSTTAMSVEGTTSVQAAITESTMTNTTLSESHSLKSSITDSVTSNPSSYGTLPDTSFSFISDSLNPTDISNIKSTSFVSSSHTDFSVTDFMSTSNIYTSEVNYVSSSSMGNYISTSINNSIDMFPTSSSKSDSTLSELTAVAPSNTPISPQVTPSDTPTSPQVTTSNTPMSPQVTPSNTAMSPQVTPPNTPMSPQVTPSGSSSLDSPHIGESTMPSTSMIRTEIHPSATSTDLASSSTVSTSTEPSTPPTTTTTTTTTTTQKPISTTRPNRIEVSINEDSIFRVEASISTFNCTNVNTNGKLRKYILDQINIPDVRDVIVVSNPCLGTSGKRKKRDTQPTPIDLYIVFVFPAQANVTIVTEIITSQLSNNNSDVFLKDLDSFIKTMSEFFSDLCNSNICDKYVGYLCKSKSTTTATCENRCATVSCSAHGTCKTIVTADNSFATQCICDSEDYYKYEGESCETKRMKWELAVAISAGSCGAVIVILVFVILICCCCKRREDKYEYFRPGYEPMSDVLRRPGPAYYRNEGVKSHQTGFTNFGYDDDKFNDSNEQTNGHSWNPEDSKDTYAKISQKLDESSNLKIKRPQVVSGNRKSGEETTGF